MEKVEAGREDAVLGRFTLVDEEPVAAKAELGWSVRRISLADRD